MSRAPLLHGLAAAILLVEGAVFATSLFPNVDPVYRAFYIDRSTDCYPLPVTGNYQLGSTMDMGTANRFGVINITRCGWRDPALDGSWTDGQLSQVRFRLDPALNRPLELILELSPYIDGAVTEQVVEISAIGSDVGEVSFTKWARETIRVGIPAEVVSAGKGVLDIEFRFPKSRSPYDLGLSPTDKRIYGIYVYNLTLAPA